MKKTRRNGPVGYGERLRMLRQHTGLTLKEVADRVEVTKTQMFNYENEGNFPSGWTLVQLAKLYNTTSEYIALGEQGNKNDVFWNKIGNRSEDFKKVIVQIAELVDDSRSQKIEKLA